MKLQKLLVFLLAYSGGGCLEYTLIAGNISGGISGTLSLDNSPYTVTGDLTVPANQSLTIEPGVVLFFESNVTFFIDGGLTVVGTMSDSIRFSSSSAIPNSGDWNGILFRINSVGSIKYAVIEYAATGISVTNSSPTISRSTLEKNNNGIDCFTSSTSLIQYNALTRNVNSAIRCNASSPTISKNAIFENDVFDSVIACDAASAIITQNVFYRNSSSAIDCVNGSTPSIWQNTIVENEFGITITESNPVIKNNIIILNQFGVQNDAASPVIEFNDVFSNSSGNFQGTPVGVGDLTTTNANGDSSDMFFNIALDPKFVDPTNQDFQLEASSPCVDAGDSANPAGITVWGNAPDQGIFEFESTVPVELVAFEFMDGSLRWTTVSETSNFGFEVQRRFFQERNFIQIGFVRGAGTTTIPQHYEFRDSINHGTVYYRLKQIDTDGSFEFSQVIRAEYGKPASFSLSQNFPNPFNPTTSIVFQIPYSVGALGPENVSLTVFNALGQEVAVLFDERKGGGPHKLQWTGVDKLGNPVSSGVYFYKLRYGNKALTRKMILSR